MSSADNFCNVGPDLDQNNLTLIIFLKKKIEKVDFLNKNQMTNSVKKSRGKRKKMCLPRNVVHADLEVGVTFVTLGWSDWHPFIAVTTLVWLCMVLNEVDLKHGLWCHNTNYGNLENK